MAAMIMIRTRNNMNIKYDFTKTELVRNFNYK